MGESLRITVIIPCRETEDADITLNSLKEQTYQGFKTVVVKDQGNGANWARNEGFKQCDTEFVLFSDNDISWKSHALESLVNALDKTKASYSYGRYRIGQDIWSHMHFDPATLKKHNYISTMSLIRADDFRLTGGFDPNIKRLQDWDLWLNLLINHKKRGVYCDDLIFTTEIRPGITYDEKLNPFTTYEEARQAISRKYDLNLGIAS